MSTRYYRVNSCRLTLAEYWRMSPEPFSFAIAAVMKLFGGIPMRFSIPRIDNMHLVEWEELSEAAQRQLEPQIEGFEDNQFEWAFCYTVPLRESHRSGAGAALLGPDRTSHGLVVFGQEGLLSQRNTSVVSKFADGSVVITTTAKKLFESNPRHTVFRYPKLEASGLWERHRNHLRDWKDEGRKPVEIFTPDMLAQAVLELEQSFVDFHIERGIFEPMRED